MNCVKGDLAVVVSAPEGATILRDTFVVVLWFAGQQSVLSLGTGVIHKHSDYWLVEFKGQTHGPNGLPFMKRDAELRPIRDTPGQDETLTWAPVPGKLVTA